MSESSTKLRSCFSLATACKGFAAKSALVFHVVIASAVLEPPIFSGASEEAGLLLPRRRSVVGREVRLILLVDVGGVDPLLLSEGGAPSERGLAGAGGDGDVNQEGPVDRHAVLALNGRESDVGVACTKNSSENLCATFFDKRAAQLIWPSVHFNRVARGRSELDAVPCAVRVPKRLLHLPRSPAGQAGLAAKGEREALTKRLGVEKS